MRRHALHDFKGPHAVGGLHDLGGVEAVLKGPAGILLRDDSGRVEQDAVEVEEDGGAGEGRHECCYRLHDGTRLAEFSWC